MADSLPRLRALRPRPQPQAPPTAVVNPVIELNQEEIAEDEDEPMEQEQEQGQGQEQEDNDEDGRGRRRDDVVQRADISDDEVTVMADEGEDEDEDDAHPDDDDDEHEPEEEEDDDYEEGKLVIKEEPVETPAIEREEEAKIYECNTCKPPKELLTLKSYLHHLKKEHKQRVRCYECPHCDFVCQHAKKLQRHFRVAHEDLQDKIATESAERSRCPMCAHVAANQRDLETHQRVHHLKRRFFRCAKCSYVTHVRARYTKHVKYHSMPMIKCDACDFRTPYKWNLDRHTRNHGGGGAFQCRACNFTADIRQSLTVHEMNHHDPPVGQPHRKPNNPCERKPRNSPKRYNQVGASDFRENTPKSSANTTPVKSGSPSKASTPRKSLTPDKRDLRDERSSVIASAECIALKCEEKGCQFITAWDSEMQRHLAESHAPLLISKPRKPLPMLIPLGTTSSPKPNSIGGGGRGNATLLRVPRVRVRPELAQIARDTEMARLYGDQENLATKRELSGSGDSFEKKNASFFDKLKERLMTSTSNNGGRLDAVSGSTGPIDLKCWCTFEAKNQEELSSHRRTHHAALSVSLGSSRCPKCRRRCKSSADLQAHVQICQSGVEETSVNDNSQIYIEDRPTAYRGEYTFPFQVDWDSSFAGLNSSGSSVESGSTQQSGRRVFKCPHCAFWASTASRFHVHIVGHLNRKPFECSLCSYRSNWRWDITKHIKLKAARDPAHASARVLMTDETGRRNYSKYNKYLAQVQQQQLQLSDEHGLDEPPSKIILTDDSEYRHPPELTPAPSPSSMGLSSSMEVSSLPSRPPPPLKAANRGQGQSLLKTSPVSLSTSTASVTISVPLTTANTGTNNSEEAKRTLWKCKRCNYRDSSKEAVLLHVKSHYEASVQTSENEKKVFGCGDCPFAASTAASLAAHRLHHRPNLGAIFKCYLCPFYVSTKVELLEHARLHGEELAAEHQRNVETENLPGKRKYQRILPASKNKAEDAPVEEIVRVPSVSASNPTSPRPKAPITGGVPPPLLLDTRALPDAPLVWVSRPDGSLSKMLKCRHCPHVASRRAEVRDHEGMHVSPPTQGILINCTDCNFTCTRRDVMDSHNAMHSGVLGTVHCLVDEGRPDNQQLNDLATLLGLPQPPVLGSEPDLRDSRLVHCCGKCPARFLCEKELRIHLRYHSTELAYSCQWCSYAARQPAHLLAHQKAHSPEYQERTRYLLSLYGHSQRHPPPTTACVEANNHSSSAAGIGGVAWIVVEINSGPGTHPSSVGNQDNGNQVFTCAKCPARYFKLDALEYHMTLHGTNNRFKCSECDYSSKTAQNLAKHQVVHRRHAETNETTTTATVPSRLPPPPDPQFGILMRGNPNFVYPGYLRNGRLKEKRYKCHKCPSAFEKREQYRVHLTLHGAKQRYRCDTCDYSVKYYANYVQHLKKHQANAEAQASKRQYEDDAISIDSDVTTEQSAVLVSRPGKSLSKSSTAASTAANNNNGNPALGSTGIAVSNQDKQSLMLMQRKGGLPGATELDEESIRCQSCPFGTPDKEAMDAHKRRHGIERMTPPCPHCDYVPRKDENASEHVRLHFTRLYKPESYLIAELLALRVHPLNKTKIGRQEKTSDENDELLFKECVDGRFLPALDANPLAHASTSASSLANQEKVIVDPNTGEARHTLAT